MKQVIEKDVFLKQTSIASHANVNPNCDKMNNWQGSENIVSPTGQVVTMVPDSDRIRVTQAPDVSDSIAEVISAPGVEGKISQVSVGHGALLGPFSKHPISADHCSPFITRAKPN